VAKLKWRVKLVAERHPGVTTKTELACIGRDEDVGLADLGLRLGEAKRLAAALQVEMIPAQMAALSERPRACEACGCRLAAKGHYRATFRSLFGDVPVRVRRLFGCPCRGEGGAKSVAVLDFGGDAVAPELAYVTARYAALAPFGKVAALLSKLLPLGGTQHAGTVRNRTLRVGAEVVQARAIEAPNQPAAQASGPVVVGLDGGYVRDRHRSEGRRFEVIAGKVIRVDDTQHRFAFVRDGQVPASEAFRRALAAAGVGAETPATVLCDGDAGFWQLQREVLPNATPVLDWWHAEVRFEHALQAARSLGTGTAKVRVAGTAVHVRLFDRPAVVRRAEASREVFPHVVLEQPCRAHLAGQDVEALVAALLLHLRDRRPGPGGAGQEARPQRVAGERRRVQPRPPRPRLHDLGHRPVRHARVQHPRAALRQSPEQWAFCDGGPRQPSVEVPHRREPASGRDGDGDAHALRRADQVGHVEGGNLGPPHARDHAEGQKRPVADVAQAVTLDLVQHGPDHVAVGCRLAGGRLALAAGRAGEDVEDRRAAADVGFRRRLQC